MQQECDLLLVLGARLDHAQVGYRLENLAPHAEVFRVEVDDEEAGKWTSDRVTTCGRPGERCHSGDHCGRAGRDDAFLG